jgi:hypothetical protein
MTGMITTISRSMKNSFTLRPVLALAFFILLSPLYARGGKSIAKGPTKVLGSKENIKIALLDTGFCLESLEKVPRNITIHLPFDATFGAKYTCSAPLNFKNRRYHGQMVLSKLIEQIKTSKKKVEIFPIIIFNENGKQRMTYWKSALKHARLKKAQLIAAAAGLPIEGPIYPKIDETLFLSSGRIGVGIKKGTKLFPQELHGKDNVFLFGSYYPPLIEGEKDFLFDKALLYQKQIDFYFSDGNGKDFLRGTSRALAVGLGRAIELCGESLSAPLNLRKCLNKKLIQLMAIDKKVLKTF